MHRVTRGFATSAILLSTAAAMIGCAADPTPHGDSPTQSQTASPLPEVSIAGYGHVTARLDFAHAAVSLPLDAYYGWTPEYVRDVLHLQAQETDHCLVEQGLPAVADSVPWQPMPEEDRLYGIWGVEYAKRHGTELAPEGRLPIIDAASMGEAFDRSYHGCIEETRSIFDEQLSYFDGQWPHALDIRIRKRASERVLASTAGQDARRTWSECIQDRGVTLEAADGRPSTEYAVQGREALIRVTTVEAECAVSSGAVQALFDLHAQYEAAYIDLYSDELTSLKKERDGMIDAMRAIVAAH
jgi:hypothetical protein